MKEFESVISYTYNNKKLLIQALTHSSYANEHKMKKIENNERLEFLGDAVLELITSDYLYTNHKMMLEGELTKLRASIVCEPTLAGVARELHLGDYLLLGKGEDTSGGRQRDSVLSDAMEAIIGSIYLDGGIESASNFIKKYLLQNIAKRKRFIDSKTLLQEHIQKFSEKPICYKVTNESGPDHNKLYEVNVVHNKKILGIGKGNSKKTAEQKAAFNALKILDETENIF